MRLTSRRKGFTLVELLIIIVVIGVLAAMMIFSSTEAVTTTKAALIIHNLNLLKRVAAECYADNRDLIRESFKQHKQIQALQMEKKIDLTKYIHDGSIKIKMYKNKSGDILISEGTYGILSVYNHRTTWYAGYKFKPDEEEVKKKIQGKATSVGVIFAQEWPDPRYDDLNPNAKKEDLTGYETVWMHALGDLSATGTWWSSENVGPKQQ